MTELTLRRIVWRVATVTALRDESSAAKTVVLDVPGWEGHSPGQHVDVRLTAADGYTAQRSYSIASAPAESTVELTVQAVDDGEVSPYLVGLAEPGDTFEVRGPVGGYFIWDSDDPSPVLLVAGGSGVVPLMSMVRARADLGSRVPFRLLYSVRDPATVLYHDELLRRARDDHGLDVRYVFTRSAPPHWPGTVGRLDGRLLAEAGWPADFAPACFVCGPTGFVEAAANLLVDQGHAADHIRTERFGPSGG